MTLREDYLMVVQKENAHFGPVLLGPDSTMATCPFCNASVNTMVRYTNNSGTHIAAAIWGRLCCCICIPYLADSAKNSDHYCPSCQRYMGTYRK